MSMWYFQHILVVLWLYLCFIASGHVMPIELPKQIGPSSHNLLLLLQKLLSSLCSFRVCLFFFVDVCLTVAVCFLLSMLVNVCTNSFEWWDSSASIWTLQKLWAHKHQTNNIHFILLSHKIVQTQNTIYQIGLLQSFGVSIDDGKIDHESCDSFNFGRRLRIEMSCTMQFQ